MAGTILHLSPSTIPIGNHKTTGKNTSHADEEITGRHPEAIYPCASLRRPLFRSHWPGCLTNVRLTGWGITFPDLKLIPFHPGGLWA